tara:strand:- start:2057 stop:2665 length:609 start_codon:yes stop_codon:yes gene_type:complete
MPGLNNMPTWDNVLEALTVADMGPDQKQAMLDQIMEDVGQGMQPSMKYFGAQPTDMDMRQMEIPTDRYTLAPDAPNSDMYRRRFPGDDIPDRPGTIVEELNPFMTRSQVQSDMEMDRIAEEMREKGRQMRMRQQQGMGARPSDMELRQLQRMDGNTLPFTRSPSNMDMRQLQGMGARPSDRDRNMSSELDNVAREMRARRRR